MARNSKGFNLESLNKIVNLDGNKDVIDGAKDNVVKDVKENVDSKSNNDVTKDVKDADNNNVTKDVDDADNRDADNSVKNDDIKAVNVDVNQKLINELIVDKVEKVRFSTYIEPELWDKLKAYGDHLGRKSGGSTKLLNMALAEFFENHDL